MSQTELTPRILITRLSAIGDCILTLPLACAVRDHFPHAYLAWTVEPLAARLIGRHHCVSEFLEVPKGWMKSPRRIAAWRHQLRQRAFDLVLDPQSLTKSSFLGWLSGAPRRIGFAAPRGRELAPWLHTELVDGQDRHLVDATLRLLLPLGVQQPAVRFDLPQDRDAEIRMEDFVCAAHLGRGFITINSAASCAARCWPASRFGRVAPFIGEQYGLPSVVTWAGPREQERAEQIVAAAGGHALLAPGTTLSELAALQRRAHLMIGSDTGPLHLAAAVGTPCLGLYGPTSARLSGPYGAAHYTVEVETPQFAGVGAVRTTVRCAASPSRTCAKRRRNSCAGRPVRPPSRRTRRERTENSRVPQQAPPVLNCRLGTASPEERATGDGGLHWSAA